jgi:hypothetical protein
LDQAKFLGNTFGDIKKKLAGLKGPLREDLKERFKNLQFKNPFKKDTTKK